MSQRCEECVCIYVGMIQKERMGYLELKIVESLAFSH